MPVRKRGDTWYARLQVAGRRVELAAGPAKKDALDLEARLRQQAIDTRVGRPQRRTIAEAFVTWLKGEARALKSYDNLCGKVERIKPHLKGRTIEEAPDVAREIVEDGFARGLKAASINRLLATLRRACNLAHEWGWVPHPPIIKDLGGEEARGVMLTELQVQKLALAAEGAVRDAILLAAYSGLRESELLRLAPEQLVDGALVLASDTKTGRPRVVPLPARALAIAERLPLGLTYPQLRRGFEAARAAAEMPHVQFRDLRRTYGSWIVQRTGNLKAAQDLLGHTTPVITARHYAHLMVDHLREAVATLEARPTPVKRPVDNSRKSG